MLKRTLVFSCPMNLKLRSRQLVLTYKDDPDNEHTVPIEDIAVVVLENQRTSISIPLLNALVADNVQVIFCNDHMLPHSMLLGFDTNNTQGETLRNQIAAGVVLKKQLWKQIVEAKIRNQSRLLDKIGCNGAVLRPYYSNVKSGDSDNREGIAARIYFQELFGQDFVRDRTQTGINSLLNYGYTILRAAVARALVSSGLFPAIGIFHHNRSNPFPLADDVMEPFRPYVDEIVHDLAMRGETNLTKEVKGELISVLYVDSIYTKVTRPLSVGMSQTSASIVKYYAKESTVIDLPVFQ